VIRVMKMATVVILKMKMNKTLIKMTNKLKKNKKFNPENKFQKIHPCRGRRTWINLRVFENI